MTAALSDTPRFDELLRRLVTEEVARRIAETNRPEHVTQRTVAAVVGMPARDYLRHCRSGDWPTWCDRRLRFARTEDVVAWVEAHPLKERVGENAEDKTFAKSRSTVIRRIV